MSLPLTPSRIGTFEIIPIQEPDLQHPEPITRGHDETDESWAARVDERTEAVKAFGRRLAVARENGDWADVLKPGANPTRFQIRQIPGESWAALKRVAQGLGEAEFAQLLVRMAVIGATNWIPNFTIGQRVEHRDAAGNPTGIGMVASIDVIRRFYDVAKGDDADEIIADLATQIHRHRENHAGN